MRTSYTILYVDDDEDDLFIISEAFEKYTDHLRVVHAHNGIEAMQALKHMEYKSILPCLIILDVNMPLMNGKDTLVEIKKNENYRNIPVVMFSTSKNPVDKEFAESLGADFITKPTKYFDLQDLVQQFIRRCMFEERA